MSLIQRPLAPHFPPPAVAVLPPPPAAVAANPTLSKD